MQPTIVKPAPKPPVRTVRRHPTHTSENGKELRAQYLGTSGHQQIWLLNALSIVQISVLGTPRGSPLSLDTMKPFGELSICLHTHRL
jgi:hypothetical protein